MSAIEVLETIAEIGTRECQQWRLGFFKRHPAIAQSMADQYAARAADESNGGYVSANRWLRAFDQSLKLGRTGLYVDCGDDDIKNYAEIKSKNLNREFIDFAKRTGDKAAIDYIKKQVERAGFDFPLELNGRETKEDRVDKAVSAVARVIDAKWWRGKLRKKATRQMEHINRCNGLVNKKAGAYVSDFTLTKRRHQRSRNNQLLLGLEAENEDGYTANLLDLASRGQSNPVNKRNELMLRMRGYEEIARDMNLNGLFLTLTCPSKYHAINSDGTKNKKYNGSTPKEASDYLTELWARIRAKWARNGIRPFGFRITEPHHDATPHWHVLIFMAPAYEDLAMEIFKYYAMKEDGNERGAKKYRYDIVAIDWSKGTAAGYIAKYVAKNIDGFAVGEDHEVGVAANTTAARVDAWASCWGIRQFQQIGGVSVSVWRELRRLRDPLTDITEKDLEKIRAAADEGDWAKFVKLMGGPTVKRDSMAVKPTYKDSESSYGEVVKKIEGVVMWGIVRAITRLHTWTVRKVGEGQNQEKVVELGYQNSPP